MRDAMDQTTLSAQQLAIRDNLLRLIGPGPARFYEDACRLMADRSLHSTSHLVGHLLREIESALRDVLLTTDKRNESAASSPKKSGDEKHIDEIKVVLKSLGIQQDNRAGQKWLSFPGRDNSRGLARQAHRDALSFRPVSEEFEAIWADMQDVLEHVLERFRARYLIHIEHAERMAGLASPAEKDAIGLKGTIPPGSMASFAFFSACSNPAWLPLLEEHGLMDLPEAAIHHETSGHSWPQLRYLEKLVESDHAGIVADFLIRMPVFRNVWLHTDITRLALNLPDAHAAQWAERELQWLKGNPRLMVNASEALASLAVKIATTDFDTAISLVAELLCIGPDPKWDYEKSEGGEPTELLPFPWPSLRCETHTYKRILLEKLPALTNARPIEILTLLCDLLEAAIIHSSRDGANSKPADVSFVIRPAIENHELNSDFRIEAPLIVAVRDTLVFILQKDKSKLTELITMLEWRGWNAFQRLVLFLLARFTRSDDSIRRRYLMRRDLLTEAPFLHEYFHLLQASFPVMKTADQRALLNLIDQATSTVITRLQERGNSYEDATLSGRNWKYRILLAIHEHLIGEWAETFRNLKAEFGEPSIPPDLTSYQWRFVGPTSPVQLEQLSKLSVAEIIEYLRSFAPTDQWGEPSPEELGRVLAKDVEAQPEKYSKELALLLNGSLPVRYFSNIIFGWTEAMRAGSHIDFTAIFGLIAWLYRHPENDRRAPTSDADDAAIEPFWHTLRSDIARFFREAFEEERNFPFDLKKQAWDLLLPLANDPWPDQAWEEKANDPTHVSINTIRGNALHAVINFAWMQVLRAHKENRRITRSDVAEVFALIEEHLRGEFAQSTTDRSVWGQWLNRLVWIDEGWVKNHINDIFPPASEQQKQHDAAWASYLSLAEFREHTFALLCDVYRRAIRRLSETSAAEPNNTMQSRRLAEHIVVAYTKDLLSLADDDLVDLFFQHAPPTLAAHAFEFIGYHLPDEPPLIKKATELWDWRFNHGMTNEEACQFSVWFERMNLEPTWALLHLEKALAAPGERSRWMNVFERLLELFEDHSAECIRCLAVATRENDYSLAATEDDELWQLLEKGLQHPEKNVREQTTDIVHHLGSLGYFKYRELLKSDQSSSPAPQIPSQDSKN